MVKRLLVNMTLSLLIVVGFPLAALADTTDPSATDPNAVVDPAASAPVSDTPVDTAPVVDTTPTTDLTAITQPPQGPTTDPGPTSPQGPDANTYTLNPDTGLWENAYYIWDPVTHQTRPKVPQSYSYNPATGRWDTTQWVYDPAAGNYVPNVVSVASPPLNTNSTQLASNLTDAAVLDSLNSNTSTNTSNGLFDLFYDARISNTINSMAATGNASVLGNTLAGNALSGNALDVTNILNLLQSVWNIQPAANLLTFTSNINGDVVGDITLNPGPINNTGPLSTDTTLSQTDTNLTINNNGSGLINNDITVGSTSGNAAVGTNTNAGNATTGSATSIADVVNVLNSAISAGQSFLGVININGNLNGDILLPPNFIDQLIASGAPHATINSSQVQNNNIVADITDTQTINNNVNLAATSGSATVDHNTNAGSATTGNAATNLTIFNLTGRQVVGTNSLLVFVNVLGSWVGLIMDAPPGSTTAALCGGSCQNSDIVNNNLTLNSNTNNTINNNLNVTAQSGDAAVTNNTSAGNATSGNATASANLMNIIGSNFSMSDWFGILFINVLGTWNGSFGVNTDAGNILVDSGLPGNIGQFTPPSSPLSARVFHFVPGGNNNQLAAVPLDPPADNNSSNVVLASSTHGGPTSKGGIVKAALQTGGKGWVIPVGAGLVVGLLIFGIEGVPEINDRVSLALLARKTRN
jgi:hypothetical protein